MNNDFYCNARKAPGWSTYCIAQLGHNISSHAHLIKVGMVLQTKLNIQEKYVCNRLFCVLIFVFLSVML